MQRHAQGFQVALAKAGFQKDLISTLKVLNSGLNFLETHAHGIYRILRSLLILTTLLIGAQTVISIVNIIKKVQELRQAILTLQLMMAGGAFATGTVTAGGAMGGLLMFILNPEAWIPIAILAVSAVLIFVLKKFFPNVWSEILVYCFEFRRWLWNLLKDVDNHPAVVALKKWFGGQKKGFAKDIQTKQASWAQKYPNHEFVFNLGGLLDATANRFNWANYGKMGYNLGGRLGNKALESISKFMIEQKYRIDVHVDGVDDKKSIMDSIHSAFSEFAEHQKKQNILGIVNSKVKSRNPFGLPLLPSGV
jgi:hypothetical protein